MSDLPEHNGGLEKRLDALIGIWNVSNKYSRIEFEERSVFLILSGSTTEKSRKFSARHLALVAKEKSLLKRAIK